MSDDLDYSQLDPGIREVVRLVRSYGFVTTDSGDGVSKVAKHGPMDGVLPFPHVVVRLDDEATMIAETKRLGRLAQEIGPTWHVEMSWSPGGPAVAMLIGEGVARMVEGER
jgi:hypothetical protein